MKSWGMIGIMLVLCTKCYSWGFYAHKMINYHAVFLLPPEMLILYKKNIAYLSEHAVDPDKRRYAVEAEGPRHYIDMDQYLKDSSMEHGTVPWWIQVMFQRLTRAFKNKEGAKILQLSAELGHYIADAHVPLHTTSNHNGQHTNQRGIHGFWESRVPELLAEMEAGA